MATELPFEVFGYYNSSIKSAGWPTNYTEDPCNSLKQALRLVFDKQKDPDWILHCISYYPSKDKIEDQGAYIDFDLDNIPPMFTKEYNQFLEEEGNKQVFTKNKSKSPHKGKSKRF